MAITLYTGASSALSSPVSDCSELKNDRTGESSRAQAITSAILSKMDVRYAYPGAPRRRTLQRMLPMIAAAAT